MDPTEAESTTIDDINNDEADNDSTISNDNESSSLPELRGSSRRSLRSLNQEQRMRVLFGLLFHRMQQSRSSEELTDHSEPLRNIQPPNRDLRILSHDQAVSQTVVCRFCLGQAGDEDETETSKDDLNPFVSPCNCSGGSEWVHLKCFRRWQCQAASSTSTHNASMVCSVCRCAYLLPPLSMNNDAIQPGALLVYMEESSRPSSFSASLVLILDHSIHGTTGLIVNRALSQEDLEQQGVEDENVGEHSMIWKKGGPVCGGRLGITRYLIAHTFDQPLEAEYDEQPLISHSVTTSEQAITEEQQPNELKFVYDSRDMTCPASFRSLELEDVLNTLTENGTVSPQSEDQEEEQIRHNEQENSSSSSSSGTFYVFSGYCKWRGGQLASELQRGVWSVCNGVSSEEMLQDEESWYRLRNFSDRLLSYEDLIQEDAAVLGITSQNEDEGGEEER